MSSKLPKKFSTPFASVINETETKNKIDSSVNACKEQLITTFDKESCTAQCKQYNTLSESQHFSLCFSNKTLLNKSADEVEKIIQDRRSSMPSKTLEIVDETLQWLRVSQRVVVYLANKKNISIDVALRELNVTPESILYDSDSGRFVAEEQWQIFF